MMKRPLIIGYGNPLREDDGIGWRAAEVLEQMLPEGSADVIRCHQLTPELAVEIESASLVIFLDAAADAPAGCVCCSDVAQHAPSSWSHHLSPRQLLGLVDKAPPAYWITCGVRSMSWREGLTAEGEAGARALADAAANLLAERQQSGDALAIHATYRGPLR